MRCAGAGIRCLLRVEWDEDLNGTGTGTTPLPLHKVCCVIQLMSININTLHSTCNEFFVLRYETASVKGFYSSGEPVYCRDTRREKFTSYFKRILENERHIAISILNRFYCATCGYL